MKKLVVFVAGIMMFSLSALIVPTANANPYKVVWQKCAVGDPVIRCRLIGGEECFANWQGHCNDAASLD